MTNTIPGADAERDLFLAAEQALDAMLNLKGFGCGEGSDHQVETHNDRARALAESALTAIRAARAAAKVGADGAVLALNNSGVAWPIRLRADGLWEFADNGFGKLPTFAAKVGANVAAVGKYDVLPVYKRQARGVQGDAVVLEEFYAADDVRKYLDIAAGAPAETPKPVDSSWQALRADVLHGIDGLDNDQTNSVLSLIDHYMSAAQPAPAPSAGADVEKDAWRDVLAERQRQISAEGWTAAHDDMNSDGQMAVAAGFYALQCGYPHERTHWEGDAPMYWPWAKSWWKPTTKRRNLVKAGALILAEIERLDRAAMLAASSPADT